MSEIVRGGRGGMGSTEAIVAAGATYSWEKGEAPRARWGCRCMVEADQLWPDVHQDGVRDVTWYSSAAQVPKKR